SSLKRSQASLTANLSLFNAKPRLRVEIWGVE
ncbi:hypothetical protein D046_2594B, partial [Vibrio parahaemolyticus V-223/04]